VESHKFKVVMGISLQKQTGSLQIYNVIYNFSAVLLQ